MTRKLGKEVVLRLARDIKPVVKTKDPNKTFFAGGGLFYVAPVEISAHLSKREMTPILKVRDELVKLCEITTEHATVGYTGKFAPSIEETLEEIYNKAPQTLLSQVVAYSTTPLKITSCVSTAFGNFLPTATPYKVVFPISTGLFGSISCATLKI